MSAHRAYVVVLVWLCLAAGLIVCGSSPSGGQDNLGAAHVYAGLPKPIQGAPEVKVLNNIGYVVGYSEERKCPLWAAYRVFRVEDPATHTRPSRFKIDTRTQAQVRHEDYTNTGYDRGHMAPNYAIDTRYGEEAQRETFLMSNVCPQTQDLNRGLWEELEMLEARDERTRQCYATRFEEIWVIAGPIFDEDIQCLPAGVEIPDEFYKIIVDEEGRQPRVLAFIMSQKVPDYVTLQLCLTSVDAIEELTGLDFLSDLPDAMEEKLESVAAEEPW